MKYLLVFLSSFIVFVVNAEPPATPPPPFNTTLDTNVVNTPNVNVTNTPDVNVKTMPDVNATVTGTVNANILNTPTVNVGGTPNVNVANTPTVKVNDPVDVNVISAPGIGRVIVDNDESNPVSVTVTNGSSSSSGEYRFVGRTQAIYYGNEGLNGMNAACAYQYGDDARMCNSEDILLTPNLDRPLSTMAINTRAWVQPKIITAVYDPNGFPDPAVYYVDASGASTTANGLNCYQWKSSSSSHGGMVVYKDGNSKMNIRGEQCDNANPVACCTPQ